VRGLGQQGGQVGVLVAGAGRWVRSRGRCVLTSGGSWQLGTGFGGPGAALAARRRQPAAAQGLEQAHVVGADIGLAVARLSCVLSWLRWVSSTVWKSTRPLS
jgi:hypothetical protein